MKPISCFALAVFILALIVFAGLSLVDRARHNFYDHFEALNAVERGRK